MVVDTPGFDDSEISDRDILRSLSTWLESSYRSGKKLTGILYLHRISDPRMQGSALRNLHIFKSLIGEHCFQNVMLGTTFWSTLAHDPETAERRESELIDTPEFWGGMIDKGADICRLPTTQYAARALLQRMAKKEAKALRIQEELVVHQLGFENTSANNQMVEQEVKKAEEKLKLETDARKEAIEAEIRSREQQRQEEIEAKRREMEKDVEAERARNDALKQECQRQLEEQERRAAYLREAEERLQKENEEQIRRIALEEVEQQALDLRKQKRAWFRAECGRQERLLRTGNKSHHCYFTPNSRPYQIVCDNCFRNLGDQEFVSTYELRVYDSWRIRTVLPDEGDNRHKKLTSGML